MDVEASPITMSTKDTSGVSSSVCPTVNATACADGSSGCVVSAYDVAAAPSRATSAMGALDMPSSICSPMDVATGRAFPVDAMAAPALLLLTSDMAPTDSWCAGQRARLIFGAILRGLLLPPTLQKT
jgi:hypothetical protein